MGHRDASGWHVDEQTPFQAKPDTYYNMNLAVNGLTATLVINNVHVFTHAYQARVIDGFTYGLNWGLIGMGTDNSRGSFDNVAVKVLPPQVTFQATESFAAGAGPMFGSRATGDWTPAGGRYLGTPMAGQEYASNLVTLGADRLHANSALDLSATFNTAGRAGFIFDRYTDGDFKFAALDVAAGQVLIGHRTANGHWKIDASVAATLASGVDYKLGLSLRGSTANVTINGQIVLARTFNATTVDGMFGLFAQGGTASFDEFSMKTNDQGLQGYALPSAEGEALLLGDSSVLLSASTLDGSLLQADPVSAGGSSPAGTDRVLAALQQDWLLELERRPVTASGQNGNGTGLSLSPVTGDAGSAGKVAVSPATPGEALLQPADDDWLILNRN
jgi:hypothetical protein